MVSSHAECVWYHYIQCVCGVVTFSVCVVSSHSVCVVSSHAECLWYNYIQCVCGVVTFSVSVVLSHSVSAVSSHSVPVVSSHSDSAQIVITVVVVDQFYIAIFSALQQAHCAVVTCDSK